jgi:asparagine synthetase B (glutamine-hydrolysing)
MICKCAKEDNMKIHLSGVGADEIISDYGFGGRKFAPHSNFGGLFPADLRTIFP